MIKWLLFIFLLLFLLPVSASDTNAQAGCLTGQGATGLISAPTISGFGSTTGVCNQDPSSAFKPYKIPTYDSLKSLYYTQSKALKEPPITSLPATIADQTIYFVTGNLTINSNPTGGGTAVIFVEGNLDISQNLTYGTVTTGLVFIVQGNVYISSSVSRIDAIIISSGTIYTAADPTTCNHKFPVSTTSPLVINGSLISIYKDRDQAQTCTSNTPPSSCPIIEFCRTLSAGNIQASEQINHQVKYLVLLRNILSDTLQRWSEVQ